MHNKYKFISLLLFGLYLTICFHSDAASEEYYTVKNFKNNWQVYDKYFQKYIPLTTKNTQLYNGGIFLSKRNDQEYFVSFYSNKDLSLFIDNKLIYKHPTGLPPQRVRLSMSLLSKHITEDPFLLIFHNNQFGINSDSVCLQIKLPLLVKPVDAKLIDQASVRVKTISYGREGFIIAFLSFVCFLVFYKFVFMKGRTLLNVGLDKNMELLLLDRSGVMSIFLIIINSLLFMMLFYLFAKDHTEYFNIPFRSIFNNSVKEFSYVFYLLAIFALMQTLKIIYVKIINAFTFSSGVSSLQNYLLLNYLFQAGLFLLPIILVISLLPSSYIVYSAKIAPSIFFLILVIISLLTSYMIYSRSELRNIYLFSYICTAEIVPLGIAFRVLLG